jgi:hypothetical protein
MAERQTKYVLNMIGNCNQYLRYQEKGGKEAKTHSDDDVDTFRQH